MNEHKPNSAAARDVRHVLHPYTDARRHEERGPTLMERGEGIYVFDDDGNRYIEGLAGLWSVAVGFSEQRLVDAATRQMQRLPYSHIFSHKAHAPSIDLAEKLAEMTPEGLNHVFFTNSGSEANDTVVKLVRYYNNAIGRPEKKKFIGRIRGYHGITVASGSLTGLPLNHQDFDLPIAGVLHVGCPHHYRYARDGESEEDFATRLAEELDQAILAEGPETIAAFIGEPLMAAGGVLPPPATYWQKIQAVCRKHDILVVADEVITGFGRLGTTFGSDYYGIEPDVMVLSKQITSSYQPLAAVMISDALYEGVADNSARIGGFGHGFTGSGHPVATAVALENLKIIEERGLVQRAADLSPVLLNGLAAMSDHALVGEVRGAGLIAAVELVADKETKAPFDPAMKLGMFVYEQAQKNGLVVRAIGDTIAFCPPLIISEEQIGDMLGCFEKTLRETETWVAQQRG
ncbi:aspartate aminotransferase family protein [Oricola sp.]|uniref:aspartate aminotransferase family protein n=1 Tax=Oricola sp. TaxID=1979950 RepID=UPI0025DEAEB1|nr:aspartate aminotransferase family protein [Oricola sp.]MCI5075238.1 aspartate aminotransferase family protein [Oricola sp.]